MVLNTNENAQIHIPLKTIVLYEKTHSFNYCLSFFTGMQ
jgi:hypothetical protein